jgi:argininosuccinate lyase
MLNAAALPCGVMLVALQKISPPVDDVAPVSRLKDVLAGNVGVPFRFAHAVTGSANARMTSALLIQSELNMRSSF